MKKCFVVVAIVAMAFVLVFAGCAAQNASEMGGEEAVESKTSVLDDVYVFDHSYCGYSFKPDGIVIYYETNAYKPKSEPQQCKPEYWYGTYEVDDNALTIKLSGEDRVITGVILGEDQIVIDGETCEKMTKTYFEWCGEDAECWAELDKMIGMS